MSTRAIAPIVGAHHDTVANDLTVVGNPTRQITGRDGKSYTPPAPKPPANVDAETGGPNPLEGER